MIAAVLAGGRSRRMGAPKALAPLGGRPLAAWPVEAARAAGLDPVLVAKPDSPLPELGVPVWREPAAPAHPLCGVVAALERAQEPLVAIACDQPWLPPALLAALASAAPASAVAVPAVGGRPEPFPGRYTPDVLDALRTALAAEASVRATVERLGPVLLDAAALRAFGEPARLIASVNTPEALASARVGFPAMPPTAEQWLEAFAAALGRPAPTPEEIDAVLALAGVAAHASERRAAPVACWLAASAGVEPDEARRRAAELSGEA